MGIFGRSNEAGVLGCGLVLLVSIGVLFLFVVVILLPFFLNA